MRLRKLFSDDTRTPVALERCVYTLPEAAPIPAARPSAGLKVRFVDATAEGFSAETARSSTTPAVRDSDEKGGCTVFVVDPQGTPALLKMDAKGKFTRSPLTLTLA